MLRFGTIFVLFGREIGSVTTALLEQTPKQWIWKSQERLYSLLLHSVAMSHFVLLVIINCLAKSHYSQLMFGNYWP